MQSRCKTVLVPMWNLHKISGCWKYERRIGITALLKNIKWALNDDKIKIAKDAMGLFVKMELRNTKNCTQKVNCVKKF